MKRLLCAILAISAMVSISADDRGDLITLARKYLGTPYRSAGSTPKGFDCSGFVWFVYHNAVEMDIPRSSRGIWASDAETVALKDARPGDVIVFSSQKGGKGSINHSAILLDENAVIHAVSDGPRRGVVVSPLSDRYFGPRIIGVKRFLPYNSSDLSE
ncbi:MAG: C40 family peptidase [Treponema sp.]|jgi:cell wall-associated NlpC family hydrolase|nr:C40 family peptidase [Treponema sp.]